MDDTLAAAARGARVRTPIDAATIAAAADAGMTALLAHAADDPPRALRLAAAAVEARAMSMSRELARIVNVLTDAGVPVLALKGPVASQQLYGDPGLRAFSDLDLITPEPAAAEALLQRHGYRDEIVMTARQRATKRRFHNGTSLVNDERRAIVDLHWSFGHVQFPLALRFEDAWARRTSVPLSGAAIPTLGPADLAVFTCAHAAKHYWFRLEMLAQIAALSRLPIDWAEVDRIALAARAARRVGMSFLLAHDVVGSEVPPLPRCLDASRRAFPALRRLWMGRGTEHHVRGRALSLMLDRRADAFLAAAAAVFVPTHSDWAAANLPEPLQWLARPFRLARVRLRRR